MFIFRVGTSKVFPEVGNQQVNTPVRRIDSAIRAIQDLGSRALRSNRVAVLNVVEDTRRANPAVVQEERDVELELPEEWGDEGEDGDKGVSAVNTTELTRSQANTPFIPGRHFEIDAKIADLRNEIRQLQGEIVEGVLQCKQRIAGKFSEVISRPIQQDYSEEIEKTLREMPLDEFQIIIQKSRYYKAILEFLSSDKFEAMNQEGASFELQENGFIELENRLDATSQESIGSREAEIFECKRFFNRNLEIKEVKKFLVSIEDSKIYEDLSSINQKKRRVEHELSKHQEKIAPGSSLNSEYEKIKSFEKFQKKNELLQERKADSDELVKLSRMNTAGFSIEDLVQLEEIKECLREEMTKKTREAAEIDRNLPKTHKNEFSQSNNVGLKSSEAYKIHTEIQKLERELLQLNAVVPARVAKLRALKRDIEAIREKDEVEICIRYKAEEMENYFEYITKKSETLFQTERSCRIMQDFVEFQKESLETISKLQNATLIKREKWGLSSSSSASYAIPKYLMQLEDLKESFIGLGQLTSRIETLLKCKEIEKKSLAIQELEDEKVSG